MNNICPVCKQQLKEGESLVAEYYPPRNWWTIIHVKAGMIFDGNLMGPTNTCAEAGFVLTQANDPIEMLLRKL